VEAKRGLCGLGVRPELLRNITSPVAKRHGIRKERHMHGAGGVIILQRTLSCWGRVFPGEEKTKA